MSDRQAIGLKVDECPSCGSTCAHYLDVSVRRVGGRGDGGVLRCSKCNHEQAIPAKDLARAFASSRLSVGRARGSFKDVTAPGDIRLALASEVHDAFVDPDAWAEASIAAARTNRSRGWTDAAVQAELYDTVALKPDVSPSGGRLGMLALVGAVAVLGLVVLGAINFLVLNLDDGDGQLAAAVLASPGSSLQPAESPSPAPTLEPTPGQTPVMTATPNEPRVTALTPTALVRPTPQARDSDYAEAALSTLATHLPSELVASCIPVEQPVQRLSLAAYRCQTSGAPEMTIEYILFDTLAPAIRAMDSSVAQLRSEGRRCARGREMEQQDYARGLGQPTVGRTVCVIGPDDLVSVLWTHDGNRMLMRADFDISELAEFEGVWESEAIWPCETDQC